MGHRNGEVRGLKIREFIAIVGQKLTEVNRVTHYMYDTQWDVLFVITQK